MGETIRVVLDALGGDSAPRVPLEGAVAAARELPGIRVIVTGDKTTIDRELRAIAGGAQAPLEVVHAAEVVGMDETPAVAVRSRRDNSMSVGMRLVREGAADAFVTAGNTGAALAAALLDLGRIQGIRRPALATVMPGLHSGYLLLDIGANADCRPSDLVQFALMGQVYAGRILGCASPRIGLVSNGEEEGKGNELVKEAYGLLKQSGLRFVGNVEGKDLPHGVADVVVTDGFTGNVLLKTTEGVVALVLGAIKEAAKTGLRGRVGGLLLRPLLKQALAQLDPSEVGGAPLLGVAGVVLVGHGRSDVRAIVSLIRAGANAARQGLVGAIRGGLADMGMERDQAE